ncbi:hypothetical protein [Tenacibaculum aiptasiae]|uniref:hypothetical protein n=1 Tax=Tenacibaculum aiptasiae TaxID=426481 RepID=UPI003B5CE087
MVVFSVLLGFLLTITTLLHTIDNTAMQLIKNANSKYKILVHYLNYSIYSALVVSVISFTIPVFKSLVNNFSELIIDIFKYIILYLIFTSTILIIRFIIVFIKIMTTPRE